MSRIITTREYFGAKIDHPDAAGKFDAAVDLLEQVNKLLLAAHLAGYYPYPIDPDTGTQLSGSRNGAGDGGFRLSTATTGAAKSAHKLACAIDIYDPNGTLDAWLTDKILAFYGLYREHPDATPGWCHLQSLPPRSGKRTFYP